MADMFTIWERRGHLDDLKIVYIGDGHNIVHPWLRLATRLPFHFVCICPERYSPDSETVQMAKDAGLSTIEIFHDPKTSVQGADVIYTDVWASMGQENELVERIKHFREFYVDDELMKSTGQDTFFMHALPAKRGIEVTDSVMDSKASIIYDEAENRMHVQNAIILKIAGKR